MSSTKQIAIKPALGLILFFTTGYNFFASILEPSSTPKTPVQNKSISGHRIFAGGNVTVGSLEREGSPTLDSKTIYKRCPLNSISFAQGFRPNVKNPVPGRSERGQSVIFLPGAGRTQTEAQPLSEPLLPESSRRTRAGTSGRFHQPPPKAWKSAAVSA